MSILHLLSAIANGVKAKENTVASNKDLRFFIFKHSVISIKNKFFRQPEKGYSTLFCTYFVLACDDEFPAREVLSGCLNNNNQAKKRPKGRFLISLHIQFFIPIATALQA